MQVSVHVRVHVNLSLTNLKLTYIYRSPQLDIVPQSWS